MPTMLFALLTLIAALQTQSPKPHETVQTVSAPAVSTAPAAATAAARFAVMWM
jgi:hypothetical protein